jgi:curved DNA-binding protein
MEFKDYYAILGVEQNARQEEIKKAYRLLAKKHHPDANADKAFFSDTKFKDISEAYYVLSDPQRRIRFDSLFNSRSGSYSPPPNSSESNPDNSHTNTAGGSRPSDEDWNFDYSSVKDRFSDFFKQFFGRYDKKSSMFNNSYKGDDIKGRITIDLLEAYKGSTRILTIDSEKLRLRIKPGIRNNELLRIKGYGKVSETDTERGDLYVRIIVLPNNQVKRIGDDLYIDTRVSIFSILLGSKITFNSLAEKLSIQIPKGFQNGKQIKITGKGMPLYDQPDQFGDLYLTIWHKFPLDFTEEQLNLLRKLESELH